MLELYSIKTKIIFLQFSYKHFVSLKSISKKLKHYNLLLIELSIYLNFRKKKKFSTKKKL